MCPRPHPTPDALRSALDEAIAAAEGQVEAAPLQLARRLCDAPWRVAVIGRTSVGKSSLVARLTGQPRPVGLGGVTDEVAEVAVDGAVVLDTRRASTTPTTG
ncbi:MAG: GTPase [Myxococcota bacterium]